VSLLIVSGISSIRLQQLNKERIRMPRHKLTRVFFVLLGAILLLAICINDQIGPSRAQQTALQDRDAKPPIVDFDAPESSDKEKREKRRKKGRKFDNAEMPVNPSPEVRTSTTVSHWFYGMPSLPTVQSDVIVSGEVADANAFLSPERVFVKCWGWRISGGDLVSLLL
jgi:hypothetical protein